MGGQTFIEGRVRSTAHELSRKTIRAAVSPEPASLTLLGTAFLGLIGYRRIRRVKRPAGGLFRTTRVLRTRLPLEGNNFARKDEPERRDTPRLCPIPMR